MRWAPKWRGVHVLARCAVAEQAGAQGAASCDAAVALCCALHVGTCRGCAIVRSPPLKDMFRRGPVEGVSTEHVVK